MSGETSASFGPLLRRYRKVAGLTQEELAERALLSAFTISALERGTNQSPRKDTLALLADALSLVPSERAVLEAAAKNTASVPEAAPHLPPPVEYAARPLIGRTRELTLLERHLAGTGPPVLLLAGEPGIGKSRLLQETLARAGGSGCVLLRGSCTRRAAQEPFAPLLQALQGHIHDQPLARRRDTLLGCTWLVRMLPELADGPIEQPPPYTLSPEQERRLMFTAVERYLRNAVGPSGVLLVLDDLHWAGTDALDLLTTLVRAADEIPLRVVGAYRDTEVAPQGPLALLLGELAEAGLARQAPVGPLAPREASDLLDTLLGETVALDPAVRARIVTRTGGVPFFLVSCAREVEQHAGEGDLWGDVPWDLRQSVRRRLAALPAPAQELVSMAAVIGRIVAYPLLRMALSTSA